MRRAPQRPRRRWFRTLAEHPALSVARGGAPPARVSFAGTRAVALEPGPLGLCLGLVVANRRFVFQGKTNVVEAFEQAALAEGIDLKSDDAAVGAADLLLFKIDGDGGIGTAIGIVHQLFQVFG